jgi:uncharacterized protein (DUF952 family)
LPQADWARARAAGVFVGSPVDLADGFIHFSTAAQAQETARRHFAGQSGLVVLAVDLETLGPALKWEPSRGGELFPHLYAALPADLVVEVMAAPLGPNGAPDLGELGPR